MNLPKAKEIINHNLKVAGKKMPPDVKDALQIGSEAIKAVMSARANNYWTPIPPLPSETPKENPLPTLANIIARQNNKRR